MPPPFPDWYSHGLPSFEKHVLPLAGRPALRFLQIGAFTGNITEWLCENVLTGENSRLTDVDTWQGSPDEAAHQEMDWAEVFSSYLRRVNHFTQHEHGRRLQTFTGASDVFFQHGGTMYDFVYVDGSHLAADVLRDACNADLWLKPGGIIAFDDYLWHNDWPPFMIPRTAIESFMHTREASYDVLESGYQFWIKKVA